MPWSEEMNGEAILTFCALNELNIMNTTFEKKKIHKYIPGNTLEAKVALY